MRILYITTNFSARTHTFITREIARVRQEGHEIDLLALREIPAEMQAATPECDLSGCTYVYPVNWIAVIASFALILIQHPMNTLRILCTAVSDPRDSFATKIKLVFQFGVASRIAQGLPHRCYDLIHAHFASPPTTFAMYLGLLTGTPYSFTGHGADVYRDISALTPKVANAAGVVCISDFNRRHYTNLVPALDECEIIHCGIDLEDFRLRPAMPRDKPLTILSVGRCVPKKGFNVLLDALARLNSMGVDWQARIAGDGPQLPALRSQAAQLMLGDRLEFMGHLEQDEIRRLLVTADVFVLPSVPVEDGDIDGIPVSLMEAMATGCPTVSTSVSGIPELVIDGQTGMLVEPNDNRALAEAIARISTDNELHRVIVSGGRAKIESEFDINTVGRQLCAFFERIASSQRSEYAAIRRADRRE